MHILIVYDVLKSECEITPFAVLICSSFESYYNWKQRNKIGGTRTQRIIYGQK